jgi:hypothetical protein
MSAPDFGGCENRSQVLTQETGELVDAREYFRYETVFLSPEKG